MSLSAVYFKIFIPLISNLGKVNLNIKYNVNLQNRELKNLITSSKPEK